MLQNQTWIILYLTCISGNDPKVDKTVDRWTCECKKEALGRSILLVPSPQICCAAPSGGAAAPGQTVTAVPGNSLMTLTGESLVEAKSMALETLSIDSVSFPSLVHEGQVHVLGELPTAGEGSAAEVRGGRMHGPSSETITAAVQLSLISLILSSAACWNHREQSTFYFC